MRRSQKFNWYASPFTINPANSLQDATKTGGKASTGKWQESTCLQDIYINLINNPSQFNQKKAVSHGKAIQPPIFFEFTDESSKFVIKKRACQLAKSTNKLSFF